MLSRLLIALIVVGSIPIGAGLWMLSPTAGWVGVTGATVAVAVASAWWVARSGALASADSTALAVRDLVETFEGLVWACDAEGRWTFVSAWGAEAIYGATPEDLIGRPMAEVAADGRADLDAFRSVRPPAVLRNYATKHRRPDGREVYLRFNVHPRVNSSGQWVGARGTAIDVTESAHLEARVREAQRFESLATLSRGMAHDFNNLMFGIIGSAELGLMDADAESPLKSYFSQVVESGREAAELARQMLAFSGRGRFVVQSVDLSQLVQEMDRLLEAAVTKKVKLKLELAGPMPTVEGDPAQLRQMIMSLATNAAEAIGKTAGVVRIRTIYKTLDRDALDEMFPHHLLSPGPYALLEITDSGIGMDEETRRRIFDPFFTTRELGRGLGLPAVLGIVRGHFGAIKVDSTEGEGSTFTIALPSTELTADRLTRDLEAIVDWRGEGEILVVDDELGGRTVTARILERVGFTVCTAEDGVEGLEKFEARHEQLRLVILDMTMPRMGGTQTFEKMNALNPKVPVVLMSGYVELESTRLPAELRPAGFISKPFEPDRLLAVVRKAVRG